MSDEADKILPARIHIQIREGVLNELASGDVKVSRSEPNPDGTTDHLVHPGSIAILLAKAMRSELTRMRDLLDGEDLLDWEAWFADLTDWIRS